MAADKTSKTSVNKGQRIQDMHEKEDHEETHEGRLKNVLWIKRCDHGCHMNYVAKQSKVRSVEPSSFFDKRKTKSRAQGSQGWQASYVRK